MRQMLLPLALGLCLVGCNDDKPSAKPAAKPAASANKPATVAKPAPKPATPEQKLVMQWDAGQPEIPSNKVAVALWDEGYKAVQAKGPGGWVGCEGLADMVWKAAKSTSIEGIKQVGFFGYHMTMSKCPLPDEKKLSDQIAKSIAASLAKNKQPAASQADLDGAAKAIIDQAKTGVAIESPPTPTQPNVAGEALGAPKALAQAPKPAAK